MNSSKLKIYLIRSVADADVKIWQIRLDEVANHNFDPSLIVSYFHKWYTLAPMLRSQGKRRPLINIYTHVACTRFCSSAASLGSISTATTFFAAAKILTVRFPVPGPTSSTVSEERRLA
ncbi:hypothetical protein BC937DRAFT_87637 [Endogone sp. FLAS-F59071]|nr:hypothetical protein BC937DRAFT_87637 [Endogone sp. FLAS-F59071]|eukprot:RUS22712.1 hypothetical protein BC937DRAFT_87637 [Endogone sp. FLAS-F59071]